MSALGPLRRIVRRDKPFSPQFPWVLILECGHFVYRMASRVPKHSSRCWRCHDETMKKAARQIRRQP